MRSSFVNYLFFIALFIGGSIKGQKLMWSNDLDRDVLTESFKNYKIGNVITIYGRDIYPDKYNQVNEESLINAIKREIPDYKQSGYAVLDWEGKAAHELFYNSSSSIEFQYSLNQFIKALRIAKRTRPNVKWGFFNLPQRSILYKNIKDWNFHVNKLHVLMNEVDVLYPVFYSRSKNDTIDVNFLRMLHGVKEKYDKEIISFVWHRVEGPNGKFMKIDKSLFAKNVKYLLASDVIDKVVWWSQDLYFYRHRNPVIYKEALDFKSFKEANKRMIVDMSKSILQ